MDPNELAASLAVALGVGLMIGLQREQSAREEAHSTEPRKSVGGIRTYPLFALVGAVSVLLAKPFGVWIPAGSFLAVAVLLAIAYHEDVSASRDRGLTSEIAFLLTFLLGGLAVAQGIFEHARERLLFVSGLGVAVTALLSLKRPLHEWVSKVTHEDLYATVKFLVVAVIVLPLLPDKSMGPAGALNPFKVGLMVTLIAGISFVGYLAFRVFGAGRGLGLTGILGGLASSTAVTLSMSALSKKEGAPKGAVAMATVLASTIMAFRVIAMVAAVNPRLTASVSVPVGAMGVAGVAFGLFYYFRSDRGAAPESGLKLDNPFELSAALKLGLVFAVILVVTKVAVREFGAGGFYVACGLAGLIDVDAITLSAARMAGDGTVTPSQATTGILMAAVSNTFVKLGIAVTAGAAGYRARVAGGLAAMAVAGGLALAVVWMIG